MSDQPLVDSLFQAGAHFGYSKTRRHPSASKFVFTTKNKVDIIDIEKTALQVEAAETFLRELAAKGKKILFVGTKPEARDTVKGAAERLDQPYIVERWVGGVLTNWPEIKKRIARLIDLRTKKEAGELAKYTKKEQLLLDEEIAKMHKLFSGLTGLTQKPDALFVIDPKREHIAVSEAQKIGIPVIALANTDTNLAGLTYPIVGNDGSVSSISLVMERAVAAWRSGSASSQSL
jgi:small subunit ribosomal protein S2